jgi:hypothetical protein
VSFAFEIETHADISERAVNASVLSQLDVLNDLGLQYSIVDDRQKFPNGRLDTRTVVDLFRDGARFEDDLPRPGNHFYNPLKEQQVPASAFTPSPNWAIDGEGDSSTTKFSFTAARQYMYEALTDPSESYRRAQFGLLFRSLGQVIHHIQDMAQPQHTRMDLHCDLFLPCAFAGQYAPSLFEKYTNFGSIRRDLPFLGYAPTYGPSDTATLNSARKFWHTEDRKGIADYSNRGFVSAGTNFDKPGLFPSPVLDAAAVENQDIQALCAEEAAKGRPCLNPNLTGTITFFGTTVEDKLRPSTNVVNPRTSTYSVFDPDLTKAGRAPVFSLNRFNFYAAHDLLIPRAVGYSAGLINYFFRGRLDVEPTGPGTFSVKNLSPEPMLGMFELYYDDAQNNRKQVAISRCQIGGIDVAVEEGKCNDAALASVNTDADARLVIDFGVPTDPPPKAIGEYMLVFSGELGEEKPADGERGAVVGKAIVNPYSGVLYLAGEDATGQLRFFKVDKGGVSDATGQGPFGSGYVDHSVRERSSHYKQALLTTTPGGAVFYKTVSLALKTGAVGSLADVSYVLDAASGALRAKPGIAWIGTSPDPTVGTFEFTLQLQSTSGRVATLLYTRRYVNAQGQPGQSVGVVNLPDPITAGYTYNDFTSPVASTGRLFLSPDGTTIYPRGVSGGSLSRKGIRITLGAAPTAELFDLPQGTFSSTQNPPSSSSTQTGTCSIDYIANRLDGSPNFPATATGNKTRSEAVNKDIAASSSGTVNEGIFNGALLSYQTRSESRELDTRVSEVCVAAGVDYSGPSAQVKVNLQGSRHVQFLVHSEQDSVFSNGSLQFMSRTELVGGQQSSAVACGLQAGEIGPEPAIGVPFSSFAYSDFDYSYAGFGPCPPMAATVYSPTDTSNQKKTLYRALTDRVEDAVYADALDPGVLKFRSDRIVPQANSNSFVADTSPIGELFFASPDLAVLHHEPKAGNMPVLRREMIPSIVRLVVAIWM